MKPLHHLRQLGAVALAAALAAGTARAEDIDIYQGKTTGGKPNLLIILDNAAAANADGPTLTCDAPGLTVNDPMKNFGFEQCGLYTAVQSLGSNTDLLGNVNLGLMYFPNAQTGGGKLPGGSFVVPATSATPPNALLNMDKAGVDEMLKTIAALSLAKDKSNNNQIAQAMQEAWAFYKGKTGLSGANYPGVDATMCSRNFVLYITLATNNQKPQDGGDRAADALLAESGGKVTQIDLDAKENEYQSFIAPYRSASAKFESDSSDEWSRFMHLGGISTYTIVLSDGSNPDYEQLMVSMAEQSGNKAYIVKLGDVKELAEAIERILTNVQAVDSVFAAPVLPVSANTQGTYVNQIYMGMFRPDGEAKPRWTGNLKQYRFGVDITKPSAPELFLADASWDTPSAGTNAMRALLGETGFVAPAAVSFWTSKNTLAAPDDSKGFWKDSSGKEEGNGFDAPDGQFVEKGGVGQQIRLKHLKDSYPTSTSTTSATTRNVLTCIGTDCNKDASLRAMPFKAGNPNLTSAALGISAPINANQLINWVRGEDTAAGGDTIAGAESGKRSTAGITVRGSVHGDVLHSRPVVIDYGGTTGVVVFYGANDGMFRAINGNQPKNPSDKSKPMGFCALADSADCAISAKDATGATISVPPGGELWSFVPQEFYAKLQQLYKNDELLTLGSDTGSGKAYFFDGAPGVYYNRATGKAYLFLSARRGGRLLYALDVSDPADPKFMWKRTETSTGFGELGQTWSQPKVAMIKGHNGPVLIFGAGYDTNEDAQPLTKSDAMGRGIFIVDALDGNVLWQAGYGGDKATCQGNPCLLAEMKYAIPGDITLIDRDFDGLIDRLYAADTGGNIWRVDLQPGGISTSDKWQATHFAALGGSGATKRKFFFPPDVVLTKNYDVVVNVTGDREHPLLTDEAAKIVNRFYMIKDTFPGNSASGWTAVRDDSSSLLDAAPTGTGTQLIKVTDEALYDGVAPGFYVTLGNAGEKGVNAPTTVGGRVIFGTNQPVDPEKNQCKPNLGKARAYGVDFLKGKTTTTDFNGGGLVPSPVFGIVTVNVGGEDRQLPFLIGGGGDNGPDGTSGLGAQKPKINLKATKRRTYWYRETDRP